MSTPIPVSFQGLALLREFLANETVGVAPAALIERIAGNYGVDVRDLKAAALSPSRTEQAQMQKAVLATVAYRMGRTDGALLAGRVLVTQAPSLGTLAGLRDQVALLPAAAQPAYAEVEAAYREGIEAAFAIAHSTAETKRHVTQVQRLYGNGRDLEALDDARRKAGQGRRSLAGEVPPQRWLHAAATEGLLRDIQDGAAERQLADRVEALAAQLPHETTEQLVTRARIELRAVAAGLAGVAGQAALAAAWQPVSFGALEARVIQGRLTALESTRSQPLATARTVAAAR